jgi:methyl-accepting chemotaxis protein PixJ
MPRLRGLWNIWTRSLVARLTGLSLLISLAGAGLLSGMVYLEASAGIQALRYSQLAAAADLQHAALTRRMEELRRNLVFVAGLPEVRQQAATLLVDKTGPASDAYRVLFDDLTFWVTGAPDLQEAFMADVSGAVVISTDPAHEGLSVAGQPYFAQGRLNTFLQTVYLSPLTPQPLMTLATPLYDQNKQPVGVLALNVNLAQLAILVSGTPDVGLGGEIYLVDPSRRFVSAPGWAALSQHSSVGPHSAGIDAALQGESGQGLYLNYVSQPVLGVYRWLDDFQLALMAEQSAPSALAPAGQLAVSVLAVGLVLAAALTVAVYWAARRISKPVALLTETANRVAAGDLALRAPVDMPDDIGALARAINEMIARLGVFIANLEGQLAAGHPEGAEPAAGPERLQSADEPDALATEADRLLADLRRLLAGRDGPAMQRAAHRLKAVSVQLGAGRLADLCQALEDRAQAADWEGLTARLAQAEVEWRGG